MKISTRYFQNWLRISALFVLAIVMATPAKAALPINEIGELTLGTPVTVKGFNRNYATYTATEACTLRATSNASYVMYPYKERFDDNSAMTASTNALSYSLISDIYPKIYEVKVEAGATIVFYDGVTFDDYTFTLTKLEDEPLKVVTLTPEAGIVLASANAFISLDFNKPVSYTKSQVSSGSLTATPDTHVQGVTSITMDAINIINGWYADELVKEGDEIKFTLTGVKATTDGSVYGEDGTLEIVYKANHKSVVLVSGPKEGDKFLSYYSEEDPRGILVFEFSGALSEKPEHTPQATIGFGNLYAEDANEYYAESLPTSVEGNKVMVNLQGKLRRPQDMVASGTNYGFVNFKLNMVYDAEGNLTQSLGQGTISSWSYGFGYQEVRTNITAEFTPASGASLNGVDEIEIWITDAENVKFDGVKFQYGADAKTVVAECKVENDPDNADAKIITVAVPAEVKGQSNVVVTLNNMRCSDGVDHSDVVSARYDTFMIQSSNPANNANLAGFGEENFVISTNRNADIAVMYFNLTDLNEEDPDYAVIRCYSYMHKQEDGSFVHENSLPIVFKKGHDYRLEIFAFADEAEEQLIGSDFITIHGTTEPYKYSSVQFVGMDPENGSNILSYDQRVFTMLFDGLVNISKTESFVNGGFTVTYPFESIEAVNPEGGLSNVWKLTVAEADMKKMSTALSISVVAYDIDGRRVEGNTGRDEASFFEFSYGMYVNTPALTITPASGSTVESLYKFTVACDKGLNPSWMAGDIILYRNGRDEVARVVDVEGIIPDDQLDNWDYNPVEVVLTLDKEITDPGMYYLSIPQNYFVFGTQFDQYNSLALDAYYTIESSTPDPETPADDYYTLTPAAGSTVSSLSQFTIDFAKPSGPSWDGSKVTLLNAAGEVVYTFGDPEPTDPESWDPEAWMFTLDTPIVAEGTYTLVIPAGYFFYGYSYSDSNAEIRASYTVSAATGINSIVGAKGDSNIYDINGMKVNKTTLKGLYIVNGKKMILK